MRKRATITGSSLAGFGDEASFSTTTLSQGDDMSVYFRPREAVPVFWRQHADSSVLVPTNLEVGRGQLIKLFSIVTMGKFTPGGGGSFDQEFATCKAGVQDAYLPVDKLELSDDELAALRVAARLGKEG